MMRCMIWAWGVNKVVEQLPNPGSPAAVEAGCKCPIMDNHNGRGFFMGAENGPLFWMVMICPLHGDPTPEAPAS
jgi:hypothetical protein